MRKPVVWMIGIVMVAQHAAVGAEAVVSGDAGLLGGRTVHVIQIVEPPEVGDTLIRHPGRRLVASVEFNERGEAKIRVDPGRYAFRVLYGRGDTIVNLSSGPVDVGGDTRVVLGDVHTRMVTAPGDAQLSECLFRVRGVPMKDEQRRRFWEFNPERKMIRETIAAPSFKLIESKGRHTPVRVTCRKGAATTVLWMDTGFDYARHPVNRVAFEYDGDGDDLDRVSNARYTWLLPEMDSITFDLKTEPVFYTNRVWIEGFHRYDLDGSKLSFNMRSRVLDRKTVIRWGGALTPYAYARRMMKWKAPHNELVWGAYLATAHNDVLNTFAEPEHVPAHLRHDQASPKAQIAWKAQLIYKGPGPFPGVNPYGIDMTAKQIDELFDDVDALRKNLKVKVAYRVGGRDVTQTVELTPFVTHRTERFSIEAPRHWAGRVNCYMAKLGFVYGICKGYRITHVDRIQLFFTKNWGAGWTSTTARKSKKNMQMGFEDLRRRQSLYTVNELLTHEMLHAWGYEHGRRHNQTIKEAETILLYVRHTLADHPEFRPDAITREMRIESAGHDGSHETAKLNLPTRAVE